MCGSYHTTSWPACSLGAHTQGLIWQRNEYSLYSRKYNSEKPTCVWQICTNPQSTVNLVLGVEVKYLKRCMLMFSLWSLFHSIWVQLYLHLLTKLIKREIKSSTVSKFSSLGTAWQASLAWKRWQSWDLATAFWGEPLQEVQGCGDQGGRERGARSTGGVAVVEVLGQRSTQEQRLGVGERRPLCDGAMVLKGKLLGGQVDMRKIRRAWINAVWTVWIATLPNKTNWEEAVFRCLNIYYYYFFAFTDLNMSKKQTSMYKKNNLNDQKRVSIFC